MDTESCKKTSKNFWLSLKDYPETSDWFILERRQRTFWWILQHLTNKKQSICDIGCGVAHVPKLLNEFVQFKDIYLIDQSEQFLNIAKQQFFTYIDGNKQFICSDYLEYEIPKTEIALMLGSINYVFEDDKLIKFFIDLKSDKLFLRSACTLKSEDERIDKFSEAFNKEYSAVYRTISNLSKIISYGYEIIDISRIWPDSLESKFGTKQFILECKKRITSLLMPLFAFTNIMIECSL